MDLLQEIFKRNNRKLTQPLIDVANEKTDLVLATDPKYAELTTEAQKNEYRFYKFRSYVFQFMNMNPYYEYTSSGYTGSDERVYSDIWCGEFTEDELTYMDNYYKKLEMQFDITDAHIEETFRKAIKASLEQNIAYNEMHANPTNQDIRQRYAQATANFTKLSDSAKLSANKRTKETNADALDTLGCIIRQLETEGFLDKKNIEFPKDDIDYIIEDFRYFANSFGGDVV